MLVDRGKQARRRNIGKGTVNSQVKDNRKGRVKERANIFWQNRRKTTGITRCYTG